MADSRIDFIYLSEPDMIRAGVKDMKACIESMEDMLLLTAYGEISEDASRYRSEAAYEEKEVENHVEHSGTYFYHDRAV